MHRAQCAKTKTIAAPQMWMEQLVTKARATMGVHHLVSEAPSVLGACALSRKLIWSKTKLISNETFHGLGTQQRESRTSNELFPTIGQEFPSLGNHIIHTKRATSLVARLNILCDHSKPARP